MIITISGHPGSGKDTVGKILAERLSYKFYSMGDLRGKLAEEKHLSLGDLLKQNEASPEVDNRLDEYQKNLGKREDNFVIVGHTSARFIPHAFKVLLTVDPAEGAKRVFSDSANRPDEHYSSLEETKAALDEILKSNKKRYKKFYSFDPYEKEGYDLVIDTTNISAKEVSEKILKELKTWEK